MKKIVEANRDLCVGCNRCIKECPIETANIVFWDKDKNIKVRIDHARCINCGLCVSVCRRGARTFLGEITGDSESFTRDLSASVCSGNISRIPLTEQNHLTEEDIQKAFKRLGKPNKDQQNVDCGACGSDTCLAMARKIALKVTIPENCKIMSRDKARKAHQQSLKSYKKSLKYNGLLKDALEKFEVIWTNVESGIVIIDAETRKILEINERAARMYGDEIRNIVGRTCHDVICPAERHACPIMDKNQTIDRSERKLRTKCGAVLPIIKSVAKIQYNGQLALLESFVDISHMKEAEEQRRLLELTEQANRAKSEFLSRMSHEMRTPMNAILGMTKIAENTNDIERLRYCLSTIGASSEHLLGLINDVLDMSKIEAGKFELSPSAFNLEKALMKVCSLLIEKIEQKGIDFKVIMDKGMSTGFFGDEMRLSQVIMNLMSNSVKFTDKGGRIELSVSELKKEDAGTADALRPDGENKNENDVAVLRFEVRDSGIGMTAEQISRLFSAFEQADGSITRKYGGTGLGLAISKTIVEKMNGRIWVESRPGKGSAFIFEITMRKTKEGGARLSGNVRPSDVNVLIVDGDSEVRKYFKTITDKFGINSDLASCAGEALACLESAGKNKNPYDVVFIDCELPDSHGVGIIEEINRHIDSNTVIVMTSFTEWYKIEGDAKNLGVNRFIAKPLFPSTILDNINEIVSSLSKKHAPAEKREALNLSGIRVLLVEDIEINREIFIALFEGSGLIIDNAENGVEAVDKFKENYDNYDIVLMDMQMPVMDGCEATRVIRALDIDKAKTIPIIAMTANAFKEDIDRCLACGMNDHLAKPIDVDIVGEMIAAYCK